MSDMLSRYRSRIGGRCRRRPTYHELQALDGRLLHGIDLSRSELTSMVLGDPRPLSRDA